MTSSELCTLIVDAAEAKKARDVVVIDIRAKTTIADFLVICEGDTDRQVRSIAQHIEEVCGEYDTRPLHVAGIDDASWVCIDCDAVIAHVFLPGERTFYDLEGLWEGTSDETAVQRKVDTAQV